MSGTAWARDRSVATKILAAVAMGLAALGAVGAYAVVSLGSVSDDASKLYAQGVRSYETLADLRDMEGDTRFLIRDYVLASDAEKRKELAQEIAETDAQLDADVEEYLRIGGDSLGARADLMASFQDRLADLRTVRDSQLIPAVDQGDGAGATELLGPFNAADEAMGEPMDQLLELEDEADAAMQQEATSTRQHARAVLVGLLAVGALLATTLGWLVARNISRTVREVATVLDRLGHGDLTGHVEVSSQDEVGRMATSLNAAIATLRDTVERLARSAGSVARYSDQVTTVSREIQQAADEVSVRSDAMSGAAQEISASIAQVTAGATQMGSSIREIAQGATDAAGVAAEAVEAAGRTNVTVARLGDSSTQIGDVVKMITSIAEQTNLLALNATIEAARAGEAGKGFAVVAGEVKELAHETAKATEVIARQVDAIQSDSAGAAAAIADVGAVIGRVNDHTAMIAAAVEEQTSTTNEIARSVAGAAAGSSQITDGIVTVTEAGSTTAAAGERGLQAADQLAGTSRELSDLVERFTLARPERSSRPVNASVVPAPRGGRTAVPTTPA
ncbi:methyl-accepting chemotaxis protein [Cellulomonas sp. URHE0023]|uniref:methyl-accepting chemotaxis protein n=1 Tax=Cellulomonas sp. URHE0023 TaxID=1380354 RepID=UPI0009DF121B|nr:methyl-accepting chemotaxis protein [Cellulomonas sp. URHE0023]